MQKKSSPRPFWLRLPFFPSFLRWSQTSPLQRLSLFAFLLLTASLLSCSPNQTNPNDEKQSLQDGGTTNHDGIHPIKPEKFPHGCHPLSSDTKNGCLLPFPSSYYLVKDDKTDTGYRIAFPDKLPISQNESGNIPVKPELFNYRDGFSPITPILVLFDKRVDPKTLISSKNIEKSLDKSSPIQLIEFQTHRRLPLFAEVDANASDKEKQVLIIRPMLRLKPNTRYAVVILKKVKAIDGSDLSAPDAYTRLAAQQPPQTAAEAAFAPLLEETLDETKKAGLDPKDILLTWDFRTASDTHIFKRMLYMREKLFKTTGEDGPQYKINKILNFTEKERKSLVRIIRGTMEVPSFLSRDDSEGVLLFDEKGMPKLRGIGKFAFQINIPRCLLKKKGPVPILVYGHGLFGNKSNSESGGNRRILNPHCMVEVATDWIGLSSRDIGIVGQDVQNFNRLVHLTDRLQQAHLNFIALARMALKRLPKEEQLKLNGKNLIDGKEIYYLGISNGGIQGGTLMALSPDILRGTLNVGGAAWALLMSRSANFQPLAVIMKVYYPNPVDRQLLIALLQSYFDYIDPITYAPYLLKKPETFKVPPKKILIQEGLGDAQVPNLATRLWARTLGLDGIAPMIEKVLGVTEKKAPFDGSGYAQYGPYYPPIPPDKNIPPKRNRTHTAVQLYKTAIMQSYDFLKKDGKITQHCSGICDPL